MASGGSGGDDSAAAQVSDSPFGGWCWQKLLLGLFGWRTLGGFFAFGLALIAYTMLLKYVPLHFAASVTSAKFIGVVLAAAFLLQERVHSQQWTGMALIAIGILVVSLSPRLPEQQPSPDQSLEQEHSGLEKPTLNKGT